MNQEHQSQQAAVQPPVDSDATRPLMSLEGAERPCRILVGLFGNGRPTMSVRRAQALTHVLGAELHVVRVLPDLTQVNPLFPQENASDALQAVRRMARADRTTRAWLADVLAEDLPEDRFRVVSGDFVQQVAARSVELDAMLIVVPPRGGAIGGSVTELARTASVPVLVARAPTSKDSIVAATDLQDDTFPVLRDAAELGTRLDASVIPVHNVNPISLLFGFAMTVPVAVLQGEGARAAQVQRLEEASRGVGLDTEGVVSREVNPVDAILTEARARDVDLIVVGTRPRSWFDRLVTGSVAAQVVNRARRSVLVTPVQGAGLRGAVPLGRA